MSEETTDPLAGLENLPAPTPQGPSFDRESPFVDHTALSPPAPAAKPAPAPEATQVPILTPQPAPEPKEDKAPTVVIATKKKVFTRADIKRTVTVGVVLPDLYPDYEPWMFEMRLKLSGEAEERRQEYLSLSPSEQTVKLLEQALDEVCDLIVSVPTGFGDIQDTGGGPGDAFRNYVMNSDSVTRDMLLSIAEGADTLYWKAIAPREFRRPV